MIQRDFDYSSNDNSKKLSVVLMADSFFYSIFDNKNVMICHQSYTDVNYSDTHKTDEILKDLRLRRNFEYISIIIMLGDHHQIDINDEKIIKLFPGLELKNVKVEKIPGQALYNYFGLSPHQENLLQHLWPNQVYTIKSLPSLLSAYYLGTFSPSLHLHIEDGTLFVYAQKNGQLYLYNSFFTKSKWDILYFTLAACQATDINPAEDKVILSGWIEKDSLLFKELRGYIAELHILSDDEYQWSSQLPGEYKPHFYFIHHANIQCAS